MAKQKPVPFWYRLLFNSVESKCPEKVSTVAQYRPGSVPTEVAWSALYPQEALGTSGGLIELVHHVGGYKVILGTVDE